ncbi:MAG TPA: DUF1844 domain-containing protein [Granulicella sp.]|jgi:hypothetical protein|nr:DUF1844 domain-containing protein [Granulicella sp.]
MAEKPIPFVVTDRRKFTLDGEPRQEFQDSKEERERHERSEQQEAQQRPAAAPPAQPAAAAAPPEPTSSEPDLPPPPTGEQMEQSKLAFDATADRLDTAIRATNPGMERAPEMSFERLVQSVYMTAIMQLGGAAPEGQAPHVDILGARQSIDMLTVIAEKTKGNLSEDESRLIDSALFELRMGFLEITQALARSAAAKNPPPGGGAPGGPRPGFGPSIVR